MSNIGKTDESLLERLRNLKQQPVIDTLDTEAKRQNFFSDIRHFNSTYPGEIESYIEKASHLLNQVKNKENPMEGWIPSVPKTISVDFNTEEYHELEKEGLSRLMKTGFVLVAGGLGERLGYNNIKIRLPVETFTMLSYLGYYISKILAIQNRIPSDEAHLIPLAIMTSSNNHAITVQYLKENHYFGMREEQVFVMMQDVVPSVSNLQCELAIRNDGHLIQKPHGHGDVHFCLYRDGVIKKWVEDMGVEHVFFFQDTNALSFFTMTCTAALATREESLMISTCVKRRPHEASGALCCLKHLDGREVICNVEYNQLEDVLHTIDSRGDFADASGYSPFPGNSNILFFHAKDYLQLLMCSKGLVPEFVNPKLKNGSRSEYLQPARLESMMQDFPKLLLEYPDLEIRRDHLVVTYPRYLAWSPVKNAPAYAKLQEAKTGNPESAVSGEADQLALYKRLLLSVNECPICNPSKKTRIVIEDGARVVLSAECGCTTEEIHQHIGSNVVLKEGSLLIVKCRNWRLENVVVEGTLILEGGNEGELELVNVTVRNKGWRYETIDQEDEQYDVIFRMRGYVVKREEQYTVSCGDKERLLIQNEYFSAN